jgi:beta-galactosidase
MNAIDFTLAGAAVWRGGIAQKGAPADKAKSNNYVLSTTLPVEMGTNRVLVRATNKAGEVRLSASAQGLAPANITLISKPVEVSNGLSSVFPQDSQPVNLKRGPTPLTPSFVARVRTVPVLATRAGSNPDDAHKSMDDNERTSWVSDGTRDGAWIEYDFGTPQSITSVSLKLAGWRLRSYPLRLTLDGKVVFEGPLPKSLGYADIDFAPALGQKLRVSLIGRTEDRDSFGAIVEVANARDAFDTGADKVAKGFGLSVIEADILGPAAR